MISGVKLRSTDQVLSMRRLNEHAILLSSRKLVSIFGIFRKHQFALSLQTSRMLAQQKLPPPARVMDIFLNTKNPSLHPARAALVPPKNVKASRWALMLITSIFGISFPKKTRGAYELSWAHTHLVACQSRLDHIVARPHVSINAAPTPSMKRPSPGYESFDAS